VSLHWPPECWSPSSSSCPKADWKGYLGHRTGVYSIAQSMPSTILTVIGCSR
jgi:hypothetical protein